MEHAFEPGAPNQPAVRMPSDAAPPPASTLMSRALTDEELVQLGITRPLRPELVADLNEGLTLEEIAERHGRPLLEVAQKLVWWWPRMVLNLDVDVLDRAKAMLKAARGIPGIQAAPPNGSVGWFRNKDSESDEERPEASSDEAIAADTEEDIDADDPAEELGEPGEGEELLDDAAAQAGNDEPGPDPQPTQSRKEETDVQKRAARRTWDEIKAALPREQLVEELAASSKLTVAKAHHISLRVLYRLIEEYRIEVQRTKGQPAAKRTPAKVSAATKPQVPPPMPVRASAPVLGPGLRISVRREGREPDVLQRDLKALIGALDTAEGTFDLVVTLQEAV